MLKCVALLCELPRHHIYQVLSCRFGIVYTIACRCGHLFSGRHVQRTSSVQASLLIYSTPQKQTYKLRYKEDLAKGDRASERSRLRSRSRSWLRSKSVPYSPGSDPDTLTGLSSGREHGTYRIALFLVLFGTVYILRTIVLWQ